MKLLSSIQDIPELKSPTVNIKDEQQLLEKLNKIISNGHNNLQIVTDFDHTLTRHTLDNGETVLNSFCMLKACPSIPQSYKEEDNRLFALYMPILCDQSVSPSEKNKLLAEWCDTSHGQLIGIKFPKAELKEVAHKMRESFRTGVEELIEWSDRNQVPVLVFSAGLGESVVAALEAADFIRPHVKVISNFLTLDGEDNVIGFKGEKIHTENKNEAAIKNTEYYNMVKERNNVILMGDNIGDAGMAEGMEHCDVVLKIGFLGKNTEENLSKYMDTFDVVLVNDATVHVANAILKLL